MKHSRLRKRYQQRLSLLPDQQQTHKFCDPSVNNNISNSNADTESVRYQANKRESKGIIHDDETTTDWTPEIPFRNVRKRIIISFNNIVTTCATKLLKLS